MTLAKDLHSLGSCFQPWAADVAECDCGAQDLQIHQPIMNLPGLDLSVAQSSGAAALSQQMSEAFNAYHWGVGVGEYFTFNKFSHTKIIYTSWNGLFLMKEKKLQGT